MLTNHSPNKAKSQKREQKNWVSKRQSAVQGGSLALDENEMQRLRLSWVKLTL